MTTDRLLHEIDSPADLRALSPDDVEQVADEIRQEITSQDDSVEADATA